MPVTTARSSDTAVSHIRRRRFLLLLVGTVVLLPAMAPAQDWAKAALDKSPRHREYVPIQAGARTVNTFIVYPEVAKKAPVVVLIHEIFGLSDWAKLMADELAAKGYIVLAPDLLSGTGPGVMDPEASAATADHATHPDAMAGMSHGASPGAAAVEPARKDGTASYSSMDDITKAVSGLPPAQVISDLNAVANYGLKLPSGNGKLAVAGFCWGGGKTFAFATQRKDLAAAFVFYGPPPSASEMAGVTAPVYGFYAGNDARIGATVPQTVSDMKAAGKSYEPVTYPGAGHGFMRAGQAPDATAENTKAWNDGFARLTRLLQRLQ